jgi:hypothetical protein
LLFPEKQNPNAGAPANETNKQSANSDNAFAPRCCRRRYYTLSMSLWNRTDPMLLRLLPHSTNKNTTNIIYESGSDGCKAFAALPSLLISVQVHNESN